MIKSFIKDMVKYVPGQIIPGIVGIVSIPVITRLFSPGEYGNYVLVMATVGVFLIIVEWLHVSIIRFYPVYKRDKKLDEFYGSVIKLAIVSILALSLVASSVLVVLKPNISVKSYLLMWIGVLVFVLTSALGLPLCFLRAKRQVSYYSAFKVWNSIAVIGFGVLLVRTFGYGASGLLLGSVLSLSIALPFIWKRAMGEVSLDPKGVSFPLTLEMIKYSFPLVVGNFAAWILSFSNRYILEFFRGSREVGIYSASYGISEQAIMLLATLFMLASGPIAMNTWEKEGKEKSQEFVSQVTRYYLIICLPAMVGLSVLAKPLIGILTGQEYYEGYRIIPLLSLGALFLGFQHRFQVGLLFYKRTGFVMFSIIMSGLLNLVLNFLLIPQYGYMAAAITTFISYLFLLILTIVVSRHLFIWKFPFKSLAKVLCASAIMGTVVYPMGNSLTSLTLVNLVLGICVGIVVYFLMLLSFREFKRSEIQALLDLKTKIWR